MVRRQRPLSAHSSSQSADSCCTGKRVVSNNTPTGRSTSAHDQAKVVTKMGGPISATSSVICTGPFAIRFSPFTLSRNFNPNLNLNHNLTLNPPPLNPNLNRNLNPNPPPGPNIPITFSKYAIAGLALISCLFAPLHATAAPLSLPATEAFGQWVAQHKTSSPNSQDIAIGINLAQSRATEMRALLQSDPAGFISHSMPAIERDNLPLQIQSLIERRVKGRGFFGVACAGLPKAPTDASSPTVQHPGYAFEVRLNGLTYHGFPFGKWRDQTTVYDAEIDGVALGDAIAIGDSPTPAEQIASGQTVSAYAPTTTGPNTLLYIIAEFADQSSDPITEATATSQMSVVSNFWYIGSSGVVYLKGSAHPTQPCDFVHVKLPSGATNYVSNFSLLLSDARNAASAQGFNYSSYNLDVVVTSNSGFSYAGYSWIGAQGSHWVVPYTTLRTAGHELGHNLGLYHANYWRTDSLLPFGKDSNPGGYVVDSGNGEWIEYGHYFSVMSAQYGGEWDDAAKPHYAPAEKVRLGWLSGPSVQYVTGNGTYRLFRLDALTTVGTPRGIRIETPATDYTGFGRRYWLSYRYAPWSTAQSWYQNGVEIDVAQTSYGSDGSIQLDLSPFSKDQASPFYNPSSPPGNWWTIDNSDKLDGSLVVGRTYNDNPAGIHITPVATGNNGAGEEYIDVVVNLGSFGGNHPPQISSYSASALNISVGQPVNLSVTATDADGDALAYSWDFDEVQTWTASGLNSPNATKSWSTPGQYRVKVTVSDMKGGVTSQSQIITVGSPANTAQIWGRVLWAGTPVMNARVTTTSGSQAWTDSDGTYVLTDLTPGTAYTLSCASPYLTFTLQSPNPVTPTAANFYGADFYANELLAGAGAGSLFSISGQVTDGGTPVAGAEVRAGGMIDTTDSSGNYTLTNFINGNYTVTVAKDNWTFSPASRSVTLSSANSTGNNFSRLAPYSISGFFTNIPAAAQSPAPTVFLSNGRSVTATRQGTGGNRYWGYTINNVPAGQYSVTAQLSGYTFAASGFSNPLSISTSISGVNFVGSVATVAGAISGRITQLGVPLVGANVSASQGGSTIGSAISDSDGYYRIDNLANGSYVDAASKSGFSFSPTTQTASSVPVSGLDFAATGTATAPTISGINANPTSVPGPNSTTTLSVTASGSGPLTYSWAATVSQGPVTFSVNDSAAANSTVVSFVAPGNYTFRARVTDVNGFSRTATVNVVVSAGPGYIAIAPYQVQTPGGQIVNFHADAWDQLGNRTTVSPAWAASGGGTIDSTGAFSASTAGGPFAITATAGALSATGFVWVTSSASNQPPQITSQPASRTNVAGTTVNFSVSASGTAPLGYQWYLGSTPLAAGTTSTLTLNNVQPTDAGGYFVIVSNNVASATSTVATLTVVVPPGISAQPQSQTNLANSTAFFQVGATGTGPLAYQWRLGAANLSGATGSSLTISNVQPANAGNYTVVVTNSGGAITSAIATLTVWVPPGIAGPPQSQTNLAGTTAAFNVNATGTAPLSYQWQFNNVPLAGATLSSLSISNVQGTNAGNYAVVVTNVAGSITSSPALLTVWLPPQIAIQPLSLTNLIGSNATFTVLATGTAPLNYQWLFGGTNLSGANGSSLTLTNLQLANAGTYSVWISNVAGTVTSSNATLAIIQPVGITSQPLSRFVAAGSNVTFTVGVSGSLPLTYQWQFDGLPIIGATNSSYVRTNAQTANAGNYSVALSNAGGFIISDNATLVVNNAPTLNGIADRTIHAGTTLIITNTALDTDLPVQLLSYTLEPGAPVGASLEAASGVLLWPTTLANIGSSNFFLVRVTDNGIPALSDERSFAVNVVGEPLITSINLSNQTVTLTWQSIVGANYQVQFSSSLGDTNWTALQPNVRASGETATGIDTRPDTQRFYRVMVLP